MADEKKTENQESARFPDNTIGDDLKAAFEEADGKIADEEIDKFEQEESLEASGEEESVPEESEEPSEVEEAEEAEQAEVVEEEAPEPISPPISWSAEDKELFSTLPRKAQETVLRRESERDSFLTQKAKEIESLKRDYESIEDAISPYEQTWDLQGVNAADAIRQSVAMRQHLLQNPQEFVRWVAQQSNLDLSNLSQGSPQQATDPQVQQLNSQVQSLTQQLQQQQQAAQQRQQELLTQEVVSFAGELNGDGKPLRPFFQEVHQQMQPLVEGIRKANPSLSNQQVLQAAYDAAVRSTPGVAERASELEKRSLDAQRQAEQKKKAQQARKAGKSIKGAPVGAATPAPPDSVRDALLEAFEQHTL